MRRSIVSSTTLSSIVLSSNNNTNTRMVNMLPAAASSISSSRDVSLFSIRTPPPPPAVAATAATIMMGNIRTFATGSRGSRGYGWYHHYKNSTNNNNNDSNNNSSNSSNNNNTKNSKNRHLLGEYYDRPSLEYCTAWNTSILQLGSQQIYMDIVLEPRRNVVGVVVASSSSNNKMNTNNNNINTSKNPIVDVNEAIDTSSSSSLPTTNTTTLITSSMSDKHNPKKFIMTPPTNTLTGEKHRIYIDIATTVCPTISQNFIDLLTRKSTTTNTTTTTSTSDPPNSTLGYRGTRLYRIEKNVGIYGGDIITNTGKMGCAANAYTNTYSSSNTGNYHHNNNGSATTISIQHPQTDPICSMYHIPGTITMIVPKVYEIDSRFLLCTQHVPHIDGICYPFGMISSDTNNSNSLQLLQTWERNLLTLKGGIPSAYDLYIVKCGLVTTGNTANNIKTETVTATEQQQQQQQTI